MLPNMDEGLAVIVGALIALAGAVGVPWVTKSLDLRAARLRANRQEQRASMLECAAALTDLTEAMYASDSRDAVRKAQLHFERVAARLEFAVIGSDANIIHLVRTAASQLEAARTSESYDPNQVLHAFAEFTSAWYRGDMNARSATDAYLARMEALAL
jgi:hypothetical protein